MILLLLLITCIVAVPLVLFLPIAYLYYKAQELLEKEE